MFNDQTKEKMKKLLSCFSRQKSQDGLPKRSKMVIVGDGECGKTCLVTRMATKEFVDVGYVPTVFETEVVQVHTGEEDVELVIFDTAGQEDYDRLRPFSYNNVDIVLICFDLSSSDTLNNVFDNWWPEIKYFCGTDIPVILVGNKKDLRDIESSTRSSTDSLGKYSTTSLNGIGLGFSQKNEIRLESQKDEDAKNKSSSDEGVKEPRPSSQLYTPIMKQQYRVSAPVKHSEGVSLAKKIGALAYFEVSALKGENVEELLLATTKASVLGSKKSKKFKPFTETLKSWKSIANLNQR